MITERDLENWFKYHPPTQDDLNAYVAIRTAALHLALTLLRFTPPSADQTVAIRKLRECVMTANASIACKGT